MSEAHLDQRDHRRAIVIGGSAGAIDVLRSILPQIPADFGVPVIVVIHIPQRRPSLLVEVFEHCCALPVAEPLDKQPVAPGIWFAPADYHLIVERDRTFALSIDDAVQHSRPAIDVLFESAASCYGATLQGFVLTGSSNDGAIGTRDIIAKGGHVYAQDPLDAEMTTMPTSALECGAISSSIDAMRRILIFGAGTNLASVSTHHDKS